MITTLAGRGSLPDDHPLAASGIGHHCTSLHITATWLTRKLLQGADVVLALGARFEEQETNWRPSFLPDPAACTIQVDIDPAEIGRSVVPRIGTVGDIRLVLQDLIASGCGLLLKVLRPSLQDAWKPASDPRADHCWESYRDSC